MSSAFECVGLLPAIKIKIMCEVIKVGESTAIICGHNDHECDEKASLYETKDGRRFYFRDESEAEKWYDENYMHTIMGSVACSVCSSAAFDNAWKLDF